MDDYERMIEAAMHKFTTVAKLGVEGEDAFWSEFGGPAVDALEDGAAALADACDLSFHEAAAVIIGTFLQRHGKAELPWND